MAAIMKALKWVACPDKVELINVPRPSGPAPKHVIVKVAYSGVCGTDLHIMMKEFKVPENMTILGHEMSGTISEVGEDVSALKVGDKVTINPHSGCGECHFCVRSKVNLCVGIKMMGITTNGGWAEYVEVPARDAVVLPPGLSLRQGFLCEPLSTIVRGWDNNGLLPDDSDVLIMGAGIIGLLWQCLFHHHGYRNVSVTEIAEGRKRLAEGLGLGYKVCYPDEIRAKMSNVQPEVDGYDLIVDTTGNVKAMEMAFPWLRRGGTLNMFASCPKTSTMKVNPAEFMLREVRIIGTQCNPFTFPKSIQLMANMADKYIDYDKLGIQQFDLEQYQEAFKSLKNGTISKAFFKISAD